MAYGAGARRFAANPLRTLILVAVAAAILAYLLVRPPAITAGGMDFSAFYCASRALSDGANPYRYEPLHTCEHRVRAWPRPADVVAAPLPPYALALLGPLARLPYRQASFLWFAMLVGGTATIIWAILELTRLPLLVVGGSIAIAVLLQSLPTGALAPLPLALLCSAAVLLTRERWNAAALLLGMACIEPHVAVPALIATFVLCKHMRSRVAIAGAVLAVLSLAVGGLAMNAQYFGSVLPEHARFELGSVVQFGLSSMLHNLGVPDRAALAFGSLQYALFVVLGIVLAGKLQKDLRALVVLVPIAFAVTGGVYIHLTQVAAVLPLAFVAAGKTRSPVAWTGIALLTAPWNLLNALTPNTLVVPHIGDVAARSAAGAVTPGETAYLANLLAYAGIACVLFAVRSGYFTPDAVMKAACVTSTPPN